MIIKEYTISNLSDELLTGDLWKYDIHPITKQRANSQIHNPRASENDVVLFVAYEGNKICGYLNILPDYFYKNNEPVKMGWIGSWWVDAEYRKKGVGGFLLLKALRFYKKKLAGTKYTPDAEKILNASGIFVKHETPRYGFIIIPDIYEMVVQKYALGSYMRVLKPVFIILRTLMRIYVFFQRFFWLRKNYKNINSLQYEYVEFIDNQTADIIQNYKDTYSTRKGRSELEWSIRYPWILMTPAGEVEDSKYYFSDYSDNYLRLNIKLMDGDRPAGFMMLRRMRDIIEVFHCYCAEEYHRFAAYVILFHVIKKKVNSVIVEDRLLMKELHDLQFPFVRKYNTSRSTMISKMLMDAVGGGVTLQAGDGEAVFL